MNKTPAELWVEALRSGEYQQTTNHLRDATGCCCLGVLCEIYQREVGGLHLGRRSDGSITYDGEAAVPPKSVCEWVGLRDPGGEFIADDGHESLLHELNDDGTPFPEIADIIESRPEGLFVEERA